VFETLPKSWKLLKISEVAEINPRRPSELLNLPDDYKVTFVPMASVCEYKGEIAEPIVKNFPDVKKGFTYFAENDVLFAKITPCMQNGKAAIARNLKNNLGFGSTEFHVLRAGEKILPEWIYFFVRQQSFRDEAKNNFRGSAGQQRVPADFLADFEIPIPPIQEQQRIVGRIKECLSRLDEIKNLREESRKEAEAIFPSVLASVFDDIKAETVPVSVDSVMIESRYGTSQKCSNQAEGLPILRIPNIDKGAINFEDLKYCNLLSYREISQLTLEEGDILVVRTNGSPNLVGRCAVFENSGEKFGFASYLIRFRVDKKRVNPKFLSFFLTSSQGRSEIAKIRRTAAGQYNINSENLKAIVFPLPSLKRQNALVEKMELQKEVCKQLSDEQFQLADEVSHLTQAILSKAFAGEL
jgi:type I restriction enzyme, S subunit